jgi:hypothetical protein
LPKRTRRVLLIVLALGAPAILTVCRTERSEPEPDRTVSGSLYQLQDGSFTPLREGVDAIEMPPQPWTVQQRIADMVTLGDQVYLGVNGYGIAELTPAENGELAFTYFYDPLIFRYRSLTTLIPEDRPDGNSLLCHLYFNKLLNIVSQRETKLQGISLLRLDPSSGVYSFLTPPYQEAHPEWEAVGFLPVTPQEFYIQWKYSDRNRTLFSYSHFELSDAQEEEVDALTYRKSYGFEDARDSGALKILLLEAREILDEPGFSTAYQLHIRFEDRPLLKRYEYHPADFLSAKEIRLLTLSGIHREGMYLLLLPDGLLLRAGEDSRQVRRMRLPSLPQGYVYRDMLPHGRNLVAAWEQTAFTDVGAAGIFFGEFPLIP